VVDVSDQHGTIDKFDALILDAIRSVVPEWYPLPAELNPDKTLSEQGIDLRALRGKIFFQNLGDFMDRGPYGVKIYNRSKELIDAKLSDFVVGNHDLWEFLHLQGFHLPWYPGYNLYGYKDSYDAKFREGDDPRYGDVKDLLKRKHDDPSDAVAKSRFWWAKVVADYVLSQQEKQKKKGSSYDRYDAAVNGEWDAGGKKRTGAGLYSRASAGMDARAWGKTKEGQLWDIDTLGHMIYFFYYE
jgi:hypothetical protein